ncbi:MAG TPA: DNA internalization-related competence protein ComEC/Rec2 [Dehalococcoidales bacterium]|nr:DNA internalization-related competence protein ComEC/Rec2 [Dehalococcoidales bacterium]
MLLISISLAWIAGIFLGSYFSLPWWFLASGLVPAVPGILYKARRKILLTFSAILVFFCGGAAYYPASLPENTVKTFIDTREDIEITGIIGSPPEIKDKTAHLEIEVQTINSRPVSGRILAFVSRYPEFSYGDLVRLQGRLTAAPQFEGFDYQVYLTRQGIQAVTLYPEVQTIRPQTAFSLLGWMYNVRQKLSEALASALPEPHAGLSQGILLGIRTAIPSDLKNDLSVTGTAHLIAISGINLTIIAGTILTLGIRIFGRRHYYYIWLALAIIWFYTILAGLQSPVIRAAFMASVFLICELLGRQKLALPALVLSAAIMAGIDPQVLWSISFQLSFLAMFGLIMISPIFQNLVQNQVTRRWGEESWAAKTILPFTDSFSVSLGSVLAIWPVVAFNFGIVSFIGPLATFLIAPVLTPIIFFSALTALAGLLSAAAGQVTGWLNWLFLSYMLLMIKFFASLPLVALQAGTLHFNWVRIYYLILFLSMAFRSYYRQILTAWPHLVKSLIQIRDWFYRTPKKYTLIPLLVVAFLSSTMAATLPDSRLHVSFLDIGEGDAILIQSAGQNILVDGGLSPHALVRELSRKLPFWDRRLSLVILTHPHLDHLTGLVEALKRYQVQQVLAPNIHASTSMYSEWQSILERKNLPMTLAEKGQQVKLKNGTCIEILNPGRTDYSGDKEEVDSAGIVAKITYGEHSFLLTADIDQETEMKLLKARANIRCTILKVAHHGSRSSSSPGFLSATQAQFVVISSDAGNRYGHPSPEVLKRMEGRVVYRTDLSGTIEFTTDGERMWVKTDR